MQDRLFTTTYENASISITKTSNKNQANAQLTDFILYFVKDAGKQQQQQKH